MSDGPGRAVTADGKPNADIAPLGVMAAPPRERAAGYSPLAQQWPKAGPLPDGQRVSTRWVASSVGTASVTR
jgi:hypothetical protein